LGTKKEAGRDAVFGWTSCGSQPKTFVSLSPSQDRGSTEGEMGKVSFATKSGSLIFQLLSSKRLLSEGPT